MQDVHRTPVYGLDVMRLAAALLVAFYHFGFKAWATPGNPLLRLTGLDPSLPSWTGQAWWGWIGVQIFFVISGAVIAYSSQGVSGAAFARRRAARLWPALFICSLFALAVAVLSFGAGPLNALVLWSKTVMFIPFGPWIIGQFWTLPIEVSFYCLFWVLIVTRRAANLELVAWTLALISAIFWVAVAAKLAPAGRLTELLLLQHGCYFALGIMLANIRWREFRARYAVLLAICAGTAAFQIRTAAAWEVPTYPALAAGWLAPFAVWIAACAMIAASFAFKRQVATAVGRWDGAVRLAGLMTYPLYLVHIHAGGPVLVAAQLGGLSALVAVGSALLAAIVVALVLAVALAPPLHRLTTMMLGGRRRVAPALR